MFKDSAAAVNANDMRGMEAMLSSQAMALNTVFAELSRRAVLNMGQHLEATETYMRLALKGSISGTSHGRDARALKNPPVVYAKQANFAAGPQQVNNGAAQAGTTAPANEILEDMRDGERLDTRTASAAVAFDSIVATLGKDNRPRTEEGKRISSRNAYKGGKSRLLRELNRWLGKTLREYDEA